MKFNKRKLYFVLSAVVLDVFFFAVLRSISHSWLTYDGKRAIVLPTNTTRVWRESSVGLRELRLRPNSDHVNVHCSFAEPLVKTEPSQINIKLRSSLSTESNMVSTAGMKISIPTVMSGIPFRVSWNYTSPFDFDLNAELSFAYRIRNYGSFVPLLDTPKIQLPLNSQSSFSGVFRGLPQDSGIFYGSPHGGHLPDSMTATEGQLWLSYPPIEHFQLDIVVDFDLPNFYYTGNDENLCRGGVFNRKLEHGTDLFFLVTAPVGIPHEIFEVGIERKFAFWAAFSHGGYVVSSFIMMVAFLASLWGLVIFIGRLLDETRVEVLRDRKERQFV